MKQKIFFIFITHFFLLSLSQNLLACDSKSCENNYLISANKYKNNGVHQAITSQREKAQYSANYKRQQIALVNVRRAHALNQARRKYASKNRINLTHQKISVVNVHRAHALNKVRKKYALNHLKQKRSLLLALRARNASPLNRNTLSRNNYNQEIQKLANIQARKPHASGRRKATFSHDRHKSANRIAQIKARKTRVKHLKKHERQRLANLKTRRANTIARERKEYSKYGQRRKVTKKLQRIKLPTANVIKEPTLLIASTVNNNYE